MSPTNDQRSPKRRRRAAITLVITVGMVSVILFAMSAHATESEAIVETEVCFTVKVIGDPDPHQVSGTLFHDKNSPGPRTALLLLHGSAATRSSWDGESPHITGVSSIVRPLAAAGYDVFAIDRLGYGRSPYREGKDPFGWALTQASYREMTNEMVEQIRDGSFGVGSTDSCASGDEVWSKPDKVVLMGVSSGAGLAQYYATKYHNIAGIVSLSWANQGASSRFLEYYATKGGAGQIAESGHDYVYFTHPEEDGYSEPCEDFLFYKPGLSQHALAQLCGPEGFGGDSDLMPSGDTITTVNMQQEIRLGISFVGPTPALLVFARQDTIFTSGWFQGDQNLINPEIEMWTEGTDGLSCNCPVTVLWQEKAGHAGWFHLSSKEMVDGVIDWLAALEGKP